MIAPPTLSDHEKSYHTGPAGDAPTLLFDCFHLAGKGVLEFALGETWTNSGTDYVA